METEKFLHEIEKPREQLNLTLVMSDLSNKSSEAAATLDEAVSDFKEIALAHKAEEVCCLLDRIAEIISNIFNEPSDEKNRRSNSLLLEIHQLLEEELDLYLSGESLPNLVETVEQMIEKAGANPDGAASEPSSTEASTAPEQVDAVNAAAEIEIIDEVDPAENLVAVLDNKQQAPEPDSSPPEDELSAYISKIAPEMVGDEILICFLDEAGDGLEETESSLMSLEKDPGNSECINSIFRAMHTIKGTSRFIGLDMVGTIAHSAEDLLSQIRDGKLTVDSNIVDTVLQTCDCLKQLFGHISDLNDNGGDASSLQPIDVRKILNRLSIAKGEAPGDLQPATPAKAAEVVPTDNSIVENTVTNTATNITTSPGITVAAAPNQPTATAKTNSTKKAQAGKHRADVVKVPADKLDELSELIGELVIAFSILSQNEGINAVRDKEALERITQIEKITEGLRDRVLEIRMFPLGSVFQRLERQVRDLSRSCNKNLELIIKGKETKLDKSLIDEIFSPLMHLVRNSIDHGIETLEERRAVGKIEEATLMIKAYHKGDNVQIEVFDDGKGLNKKQIFAKAVEKGIARADEQLSEREIFDLIMKPGFSTASKVTDISGRGVGMDVVKKTIDALMGRIVIESVYGEWTRVTMVLPLTTSIIEGLVVQVGDRKFVAPMLAIKQTIKPNSEDIRPVHDREGEVIIFADEVIPILRLYELYEIEPRYSNPADSTLIIVEHNEKKYALMVDELLHRQQIVIKRLSRQLGNIQGISGGTILGNGQVGFVLDLDKLVFSFFDVAARNKVPAL